MQSQGKNERETFSLDWETFACNWAINENAFFCNSKFHTPILMNNPVNQNPPLPELAPGTNPPYELKNIRRNDAQILDFPDWVSFFVDVEGDDFTHPEVW